MKSSETLQNKTVNVSTQLYRHADPLDLSDTICTVMEEHDDRSHGARGIVSTGVCATDPTWVCMVE